MPTTLRNLPAPGVRKEDSSTYIETLTPNGWERIGYEARRTRYATCPTVTVRRYETTYREPIGTRGERSHVGFYVSGELRNEYLKNALPTAVVKSDEDGVTLAVWYY